MRGRNGRDTPAAMDRATAFGAVGWRRPVAAGRRPAMSRRRARNATDSARAWVSTDAGASRSYAHTPRDAKHASATHMSDMRVPPTTVLQSQRVPFIQYNTRLRCLQLRGADG